MVSPRDRRAPSVTGLGLLHPGQSSDGLGAVGCRRQDNPNLNSQLGMSKYPDPCHISQKVPTLYYTDGTVVEIEKTPGNPAKSAAQTLLALQSGADLIYQATFLDGDLVGHADFLRKVPRPSALGDYSYEVIDTKLGRTPKAGYVLQLCPAGSVRGFLFDGQPRPLHIQAGLDAIDFTRGPVQPQVPQSADSLAVERLVFCDKFVLDRRQVQRQEHGNRTPVVGQDRRFHFLGGRPCPHR